MDDIFLLTKQLADVIDNCETRLRYNEAKQRLLKNEELHNKIKQYKKHHIDFQLELLSNNEPSFEKEKFVSSLYSDLMLYDDARQFLESENDLVKFIANIENVIMEKINIDLDF